MLSKNIKALRKAKGLSQEELAIKLNVVRQTVSKWEKCACSNHISCRPLPYTKKLMAGSFHRIMSIRKIPICRSVGGAA